MRFRTWPVAAIGLVSLLLLVIYTVLTAVDRVQDLYTQLDELGAYHRDVDAKLRRLRSDVNLSGIYVRDYLLDTVRERTDDYQEKLTNYQSSTVATLAELRATWRGGAADEERMRNLQSQLDEYWRAFEPLMDWTVAEKISLSAGFLRREVLPRREAVLAIAGEIEQLNNTNLNVQRAEVTRQHAAFRQELYTLLWRSLFLGTLVAVVAVIRLRILERRSEVQKLVAQHAEQQLRELSQQLVAAQEEERRKLSRELHDHVGQMLTALRMELGRIDRLGRSANVGIVAAVNECRQLTDEMVRLVRDLALGLRPSMLDDMGLQPTLEWQARDFTRRYNVPVELEVSGNLDGLTDQQRTCVYRVIQEALTNCSRHSRAAHVWIAVHAAAHELEVSVTDDGIGMAPDRRQAGLGLRGIQERVRELGGDAQITNALKHGTVLTVRLPLEPERAVAPVAS
jgi:signal transduction histidine kinase